MKKYTCLSVLFFVLSISCSVKAQSSGSVKVASLRSANMVNPINVDRLRVPLSWQLVSSRRNVRQTAYQLLVAKTPSDLQAGKAVLWNSGKITSPASVNVSYNGPSLQALKRYYWKVRIWDESGIASAWSEPASWQMGLLSKKDWKNAKWIAYDVLPDNQRIVPAIHHLGDTINWVAKPEILPIFRKEVDVRKRLTNATIFISGLGHFDLSVNGRKVGDHFLDPGWTRYDEQAQYVTFDLTSLLRSGQNAIGVMLGNGFYFIPAERYRKITGAYGHPKMICRLALSYSDGTSEDIVTDQTWKTSPGPITFTSIYGGEDFDARIQQKNWDLPGFDDLSWKAAVITDGPPQLDPQLQEPLKIFERFEVKKVTALPNGAWVYDLGQNASAIPVINVSGTRGSRVRLIPGELLNPDGTVNQSASGGPAYFDYILAGDGNENWQPQFTYYGYRYIQVEGALPVGRANPKGLPVLHNIQSLHIRNAALRAGTFSCSDSLFNKTNTLIDWAIKSNMVSVLTDCPHREKLGWLEQGHLMAPSVFYNYDIATLNSKIGIDMMRAQEETGLVPNIAPEYVKFSPDFRDSPEWGSTAVILPWYSYKWYGDLDILKDNYPMMQKYITFLASKATGNILTHGLGDWFDIGPGKPGKAQLTPKGVTATALYYYDLSLLAKIAALLGKADDAKFYASLATNVKKSFNELYFHPDTKQYASGSQTANATAVYLGLVAAEYKAAVIENLVNEIKGRDNALTAGDIGYRYVLRALEDAGRSDVIFDMNSRSDVPGYGWQLAHGATALTESWQAYGFVSNNHFMLGHLMEWFYSGLAGIRLPENSVGFDKIEIHPSLVGNISFAKASYRSPYGLIRSEWRKTGSNITLNAEIPANSTANIFVPNPAGRPVKESGKLIAKAGRLKLLRTENGYSVYSCGSGNYTFTVETN